ncbi:MAG: alkyl/aryl-sulfatase [Myxococcota bacterium]
MGAQVRLLATLVAALALAVCLAACGPGETVRRDTWSPDADESGHTPPTAFTTGANARVAEALPLDDPRDFEDARRGRVAGAPDVSVTGEDGTVVWDTSAYGFIEGAAPASVNPSLWRQATLNGIHGLFEVAPGIHQVRGYDLANMSIIQGETGFIVVDPLTARETAAEAMELVYGTLGEQPIVAVIFTHSHVDHFGGVLGILTDEQVRSGDVRIIAPAGFMEAATSENVMAGIAMSRRAAYMYGRRLPRSERGHVGSGLGKSPAFGAVGIAPPSEIIDTTGSELEIDGVRFVFQYAPESEAPAELTFYLPELEAFCGAEIVSHTMHNLYTLRGAKVRDALRWSAYIDEAMRLFGDAEIMFASHHWPMWGNERIIDYLGKQRDTYKFIHDQTLRLANAGYTPREIAERIELPEALRPSFANRGYYGTVRHNAKAVYQWYFGWYDGNPAHLDPLPPAQESVRYVEAMGGPESVLERAKSAFDAGEYRWAATLLDHLVFARPDDALAREWLARAYDQLGYQAESGPWRDVYLSGAYELRHGRPEEGFSLSAATDLLARTPMERFLEALATRIDPAEAAGKTLKLNFVLTDVGESYVLSLANSVLHPRRADPDPEADVTINVTRALLVRLFAGQAGARELLFGDELEIDGSRTALVSLLGMLSRPEPTFAIVTPD